MIVKNHIILHLSGFTFVVLAAGTLGMSRASQFYNNMNPAVIN